MTEMKNIYKYEEELFDSGINNICGVDEAGRGPLAGPVVIAAVILPENERIEGINDSKVLSEKKREKIYKEIIKKAKAYSIVFVSPTDIDKYNIYQATQRGMIEAINKLVLKPGHALIDAMPLKELDIPSTSIIKGDALSASIGAASILAKVARDNYMNKMDLKYPHYGFKHNKGYPTKMHVQALEEYGPCKIHRKTYGPVKKYFKDEQLQLDI